MTQILKTFKWDGPMDDDGTPNTRPTVVVAWQQTKAIIELLNNGEAERMAAFGDDPAFKAAAVGDKMPATVDVGGVNVLCGVLAAFVNEHDGSETPQVLELVLQLIADQVVPKGMVSKFFEAMAIIARKTEARKAQAERPVRIDDETADRVNRLLDTLRRAGGDPNKLN